MNNYKNGRRNCFCRNVSTPKIFVVAHPRIRAHELITAPFANIHWNPSSEKLIYICITWCISILTNHHDVYGVLLPHYDCTIGMNVIPPDRPRSLDDQSEQVETGCGPIIVHTKKYDSWPYPVRCCNEPWKLHGVHTCMVQYIHTMLMWQFRDDVAPVFVQISALTAQVSPGGSLVALVVPTPIKCAGVKRIALLDNWVEEIIVMSKCSAPSVVFLLNKRDLSSHIQRRKNYCIDNIIQL